MSGFTDKPVAAVSRDGRRLSLRHGPIDLIVCAEGIEAEVRQAYRQAAGAFEMVLTDLVGELDVLRTPVTPAGAAPNGSIAGAMHHASIAHCPHFITPMAAVAGAIADHILAHALRGRELERASVNNGGDIALFMGPGQFFNIAICSNPHTGTIAGSVNLGSDDNVCGVATSGWRGRSHSLGIADAVTVLAIDAAAADVAATLIANAVNIDDSRQIKRSPASKLSPDTDLGDRAVTVDVGDLSDMDISLALERGERVADEMLHRGIIRGAFLNLCDETRVVGAHACL